MAIERLSDFNNRYSSRQHNRQTWFWRVAVAYGMRI